MIEQIKQLTNEELAEIAEVSYLHNFENAKLLLGHIGYLIGEAEQEKRTLTLEKQFFDNLVTRSQEIEDRLTDRVEELQKALEGLVNLMDLTGYLKLNQEYRDAVNILQSIQGDNT